MKQTVIYEREWRDLSFDVLWLWLRLRDIYKQDDGAIAEAMVLSTMGLVEGLLRNKRVHPDVRELVEATRPTPDSGDQTDT